MNLENLDELDSLNEPCDKGDNIERVWPHIIPLVCKQRKILDEVLLCNFFGFNFQHFEGKNIVATKCFRISKPSLCISLALGFVSPSALSY